MRLLAVLVALGIYSCAQRAVPLPAIGSPTIADPMAFIAEEPDNGGRHDWPLPAGYVSLDNRRESEVVGRQSWDFAPFGTFEPERGDGFQVAEIGQDGYIRFTSTRDGGTPWVQHFVGQHCGGSGWIVFGIDARPGAWREVLATLSIARDPLACPLSLNHALTRYRLESVEYPFAVSAALSRREIPSIISEHFDNRTIGSSAALERFYLGKDYGLLRWEAWGRSPPSVNDLSERCSHVAYSVPPAAGWRLRDCRTYTNQVGR